MPQPPSAYVKAVQLLATRAHFRAELAAKLARRGYPAEEIEAALDRLTGEGYLDDRQTAMDFTAARLARGGEGRRRLRAELARRGVGSEAADEAVAALTPEDDLPAARAAAARKIGRRAGSPLSQSDLASLARHLERKGFSRRAIVAVLKEQPGGSASFEEEGDG